jgi:hypothetical protein
MSFGLYMLGFIILIGGLAWGAVLAGAPVVYVVVGAVVLLGIGIISAVKRTRLKDAP